MYTMMLFRSISALVLALVVARTTASTIDDCFYMDFEGDKVQRFRDRQPYVDLLVTRLGKIDLKVTAPGNPCADRGARVILASNPPTGNEGLGSPNEACLPLGGPGIGAAGAPGLDTSNCAGPAGNTVGNVISIQSGDNCGTPSASAEGGILSWILLEQTTNIRDVGLINTGTYDDDDEEEEEKEEATMLIQSFSSLLSLSLRRVLEDHRLHQKLRRRLYGGNQRSCGPYWFGPQRFQGI